MIQINSTSLIVVRLVERRPLSQLDSSPGGPGRAEARRDWTASSSRFISLSAHDLFGKPLHTFPDHASGPGRIHSHSWQEGRGVRFCPAAFCLPQQACTPAHLTSEIPGLNAGLETADSRRRSQVPRWAPEEAVGGLCRRPNSQNCCWKATHSNNLCWIPANA